jgi:hypothetical protein
MPPLPVQRRPGMNWNCVEVLDAQAGDPQGTANCEFCGTLIRWIHVLKHDDYHRAVEAGCCCAARLCNEYDAAAAERELKNRMDRRLRFVNSAKWKRSKRNPENIWRKVRTPEDGVLLVTVFLQEGRYLIYVAAKDSDRYCHWQKYESQSQAMAGAFELVERLRSLASEGASPALPNPAANAGEPSKRPAEGGPKLRVTV